MKKETLLYVFIGIAIVIGLVGLYSTITLRADISKLAENSGNGTNGGNNNGNGGNAPSAPTADDDPFLGPEDAAVVIIEFSDYECPYCGASAGTHQDLIERFTGQDPTWEPAVPKLKELAQEGKIKFVFRDFPLGFHQNAQKAAEASECADEQGKFWEMHDLLFENQTALDVPSLKDYASQLGLDTDQFNGCLDSGHMADEVRKDAQDGASFGVEGTPAYFINDISIAGAYPFSAFEELIAAELGE